MRCHRGAQKRKGIHARQLVISPGSTLRSRSLERPPCIMKQKSPYSPKNWKVAGSRGDKSLKNRLKSGMESV